MALNTWNKVAIQKVTKCNFVKCFLFYKKTTVYQNEVMAEKRKGNASDSKDGKAVR